MIIKTWLSVNSIQELQQLTYEFFFLFGLFFYQRFRSKITITLFWWKKSCFTHCNPTFSHNMNNHIPFFPAFFPSTWAGNFMIHSSSSIVVMIFGLAPPLVPPRRYNSSSLSEYSVLRIFWHCSARIHPGLYFHLFVPMFAQDDSNCSHSWLSNNLWRSKDQNS